MNTPTQDLYIIPDELFESIHMNTMWTEERDTEEYPRSKFKITPYLWNKHTAQVYAWKIAFLENDDDASLRIQIVKLEQLMKYFEFLFTTMCYDTQVYDSINIMLPNLPIATIDSKKIHNTDYKNMIQQYVCDYIISILSIWPVNKNKENCNLTKYNPTFDSTLFSLLPY